MIIRGYQVFFSLNTLILLLLILFVVGFLLYFLLGLYPEDIFFPIGFTFAFVFFSLPVFEGLFATSFLQLHGLMDMLFLNLNFTIIVVLWFFISLRGGKAFYTILEDIHRAKHYFLVVYLVFIQILLLVTLTLFRFHIVLDALAAFVWIPSLYTLYSFSDYINRYIVRGSDRRYFSALSFILWCCCFFTVFLHFAVMFSQFGVLGLPFRFDLGYSTFLVFASSLVIFTMVGREEPSGVTC